MEKFKLPAPEIEAEIYMLKTEEGGRKSPLPSFARPVFSYDEANFMVVMEIVDKDECKLGENMQALFQFLSPELQRGKLFIGKEVKLIDGINVIGQGKITKIFRDDYRNENSHTHEKYNHTHGHNHTHTHVHINERKTRWVVYLTAITMVIEIFFGFYTNSMALLADGWHMSTHAFALGLAWLAYYLSRKYAEHEKFTFSGAKVLALSGYSSAIILIIIAVWMAVEGVNRLLNPVEIKFGEAIFVASIGLLVNALSAILLHHDESHSDHNIRAAYLHVLADGLTSVTAILALLGGMIWKVYSLDAVSAIISSVVITRWSYSLIKNSGKDLIDFVKK